MKCNIKHNKPFLALIISVSFFLFFSVNLLYAANPPVYDRLFAVTENLSSPTSVAVDADERIYVTEPSYNRLNVYSPGGYFIKRLEGLDNPFGIAVDSGGRILVGNGKTGNVEVYDSDFNLLSSLGTGDGEFLKPCAIAVDSTGKIYVADCEDDKVKVYNSDYSFNFSFGSSGNSSGQFNQPSSVAVDENVGEIMVIDTRYASGMMGAYQAPRIQVFDMNGVYKRVFGKRGVDIGKIFRPAGIAVDSQSRIYITDTYQNVVQVFDNAFTSLGVLYDLNNPVMNPLGITMGNSNRLFIVSHTTGKVEVYGIDNYINMIVTPLSLSFQGSEGGAAPAVQSVDVTNSGTAVFNWTASTNHTWITLSQSSGLLNPGETVSVDAGVDLAGLPPGTYKGTIEINTDSGAVEVIGVTLMVTLPPELSVVPSSLSFTSVNGSIPLSQTLIIDNTGAGTLNWTSSSDMTWITLDKNTGTAPNTINVGVDPSTMVEGIYSGSITVSGEGATGSPVTIPVTLNVIRVTGTINITTNLAEATFIINGPASYNGSGTRWTVTDAPVGTYIIIFGDVDGYVTPSSQTLTLQENSTITFNGLYDMATGSINVTTNLTEATFILNGPASYSGSGTGSSVADAPVGTYEIIFGDVAGYVTPPSQTQTLRKDGAISFDGLYGLVDINIITGAGYGEFNPGYVKVLTGDGHQTGIAFYAHSYMYGVSIASGDIDGDGFDEIITAPGPDPNGPAEINIYKRNGSRLADLSINAFPYMFGANVASADFDGDGYYEVIAGTGAGNKNPAYVKVFVYDPVQRNFTDSGIDLFPYDTLYGVNVTAGDVDGDGTPELITSPGPGRKNGGVIRIWNIDTSDGIGQWKIFLTSNE
jgi:hypothetical protein